MTDGAEPSLRRRLRGATATRHAALDALVGVGWEHDADGLAGLLDAFSAMRSQWSGDVDRTTPDAAAELLAQATAALDADLADARRAGLVLEPRAPRARPTPGAAGGVEAGAWAGVLYVAEGSLLGGRVLAARADAAPWRWPGPLRFLRLTDADPTRWRRALALLDAVPAAQHAAAERSAGVQVAGTSR